MPEVVRPHTYVAGEVVDPIENNANEDTIVNALNQLPDKDGTLQVNLNADLLDGLHAVKGGGLDTIPVCDTSSIQVALNADLLDGLHASDISGAAFPVDTEMLFKNSSPPAGWDVVSPTGVDKLFYWGSDTTGGDAVGSAWATDDLSVTIDGHALTIQEIPGHTHGMSHTHSIDHSHSLSHTHPLTSPLIYVGWSTTTKAGNLNVAATGSAQFEKITVDPASTLPSVNHVGSSGGSSLVNTTVTGDGNIHIHTGSVSSAGTFRPPGIRIVIGKKAAA